MEIPSVESFHSSALVLYHLQFYHNIPNYSHYSDAISNNCDDKEDINVHLTITADTYP